MQNKSSNMKTAWSQQNNKVTIVLFKRRDQPHGRFYLKKTRPSEKVKYTNHLFRPSTQRRLTNAMNEEDKKQKAKDEPKDKLREVQ